jgi:hypothetical protein
VVDNDFSEWDSSNCDINILLEASLFGAVFTGEIIPFQELDVVNKVKLMGAKYKRILTNLPVVDFFLHTRLKWSMKCTTKDGSATLKGEDKKLTGEQSTLSGNTMNNMAMVGASLKTEVDDLICAMFQGDDSELTGLEVEFDDDQILQNDNLGFAAKINESDSVGEYVGYITHKDGWFPDVIKRAAITLSKLYPSQDKFEESIIGLADTMSIVTDNDEKIKGIYAAATFYNEHTALPRVSTGDVESLFDFLKNVNKTSWNDLSTVVRNQFTFA